MKKQLIWRGFTHQTATSRRPWFKIGLVSLVFLYVGFLLLAPFVFLAVSAFEKGASAFFSALAQAEVVEAFSRTLLIALVVVVFQMFFGTIVAWFLVRDRFPGRKIINALIDLPFAVSPVVVGYMLLLLFGRTGAFAPLLAHYNIKIAFSLPGMILATLFVTLPIMIRELIPVIEKLDIQQEKAALTLGASGWQTFWRVTLPAIKWGEFYGVILTFARALGEFGAVLVIGGGIQGQTETMTLFIYRALDERQYVEAYSAALLLGVLSITLVVGVNWLQKRKKQT